MTTWRVVRLIGIGLYCALAAGFGQSNPETDRPTLPVQYCSGNCPAPPQQDAQKPYYDSLANLYQEMLLRQLGTDQHREEIARRQQAEYREQEMLRKAKRFVELWEAFAAELNGRGTFNVKLAKEVSKSFHDLEKSGAWPQIDRH